MQRIEQALPPGTLQQAAGGDPLNPRVGAAPRRTHTRQRSGGWHGSAEKNRCAPTQTSWVTCHLTQGTGRDRGQHAVKIRTGKLGTGNGGGEVLD